MNNRMKRLKKFYLSYAVDSAPQFTYYMLSGNNAATEFYYGNKSSIVVPNSIDGHDIKEVGNTTFSLGELKLEDFEKPDVRDRITNITFSEGIEKI